MIKFNKEQPYVFISYTKKDKELVYPFVERLRENGANLWMDDLLPRGANSWDTDVLPLVVDENRALTLYFRSESSLVNKNVLSEIEMSINVGGNKTVHIVDLYPHEDNEDIYSRLYKQKNTIQMFVQMCKYIKSEANAYLYNDESDFLELLNNLKELGIIQEENTDSTSYSQAIEDVVISEPECFEEPEEAEEISEESTEKIMSNLWSYKTRKGADAMIIWESADVKNCIVRKGSKVADEAPAFKTSAAGAYELKQKLIDAGVVLNGVFQQDYAYNKISTMINLIGGGSINMRGEIEKGALVLIGSAEVPNVSAISETDTEVAKKSASVTGDITYTLYGKEHTENQSKMMLRVFAQVLKRHPEQIATLPEQAGMNCAMKYEDIKDPGESSAYPTYFRSCKNFTFENGESICIGTAYSSGDKMKKIARLLDICGEDRSIFQSEQIELPEVKAVKTADDGKAVSSVNGIKYSVYGESLFGDQTDMMTTICSKIIEKHPEKLQAVVDGTLCAGFKDAETMAKTYFRVYREFSCNGVDYVIGTSFGLPAKIKEIEKVLYICGEDANNIQIEGIELNESAPIRKGRGKAQEEDFLAD